MVSRRIRSAPLPLVGPLWGGVGGGGPSSDHRTTPTPARRSQACAGCASLPACHSRCFASAFLALRTAAEGGLCPPHKGEGKTEFVARADASSPDYVEITRSTA